MSSGKGKRIYEIKPKNDWPWKRLDKVGLGLAVLSVLNKNGFALTLEDIADVCETSPQNIHILEKRALEKFKANWKLSQHKAGEPTV